MFVLDPHPEFTTPVTVRMPAVGGPQEMTFTARFRAMPAHELGACLKEQDAPTFLAGVLRGWEEVVDGAGEAVPFTDESRDALIGVVAARPALLRAYRLGLAGADTGN